MTNKYHHVLRITGVIINFLMHNNNSAAAYDIGSALEK